MAEIEASLVQDAETLADRLPRHGKPDIRLWLRLLACTNLIGGEIRGRLRKNFSVTLPRFDLMAQLDREPEGLRLSDLSRRMMVTNGNVTGLVDRLVAEELVERRASDEDRRVAKVHLTAKGEAAFAEMADIHEGWVEDLFAGLDPDAIDQLMALLARLKSSVTNSILDQSEAPKS